MASTTRRVAASAAALAFGAFGMATVGAPAGAADDAAAAQAATPAELEVVASGLDNPRGLVFGPDEALYVAEAGRGGDGPSIPSPEGGLNCIGPSGAVTRIGDGGQERILTGLPSLAACAGQGPDAPPPGAFALGPLDGAFREDGSVALTVGLGADPAVRQDLGPLGPELAKLYRLDAEENDLPPVDIGAFEEANNPDDSVDTPEGGRRADSNPFGVTAYGDGYAVADAGGNYLGLVDAAGDVSVAAVFPPRLVDAPPFLGLPPGTQIPMQAVPTSVTVGPDGALYVGQLTGFPFPIGGANVYRVVPGEEPTVYAGGFTNVIGVEFGEDGSLYVLEIATNSILAGEDAVGGLWKVAPDGSKELLASEGLVYPGGLAVGPEGDLYVTNFGTFAGQGQVIRIAAPEPPVDACTITGTPGDDDLTGTPGDDVICGLAGEDTIDGLGGNDRIFGGPQADVLLGGDGDDFVRGGFGPDTLDGGEGFDVCNGGYGSDTATSACEDIRFVERRITVLATTLTGEEEVDSATGELNVGDPDGTGTAKITLTPKDVCYEIQVAGIDLPAAAAHIHEAPAGVNGPVVVDFVAPDADGRARGCTGGLDPALVADIAANPANYYVNVHNAAFPAGAVRGQLDVVAMDVATFTTPLNGEEEVDAEGNPDQGDLDGTGSASLVLWDGQVCYALGASDIEPAVASHIHEAPAGVNGPVVVEFDPPADGNASGCADADPALVADIAANPANYYVNVHNPEFPGGAIRGQLG